MNIIFVFVVLIFIICAISMIYCHYSIKVSRYDIKNDKIKDELKIIHLSDLHSRVFGKNNQKVISMIIDENPHVIVMTGDMVNGKYNDIEVLEKLIIRIKESNLNNCTIYYIMGNREFRYNKDDYIRLKEMLMNNKVIVLENSTHEMHDKNISIYGLNYYNRVAKEYYEKKGKYENDNYKEIRTELDTVLNKAASHKYNILLVHDPSGFEKYAEYGYDLILAGHIHGGVIRIPFINKGVLSPEVKLLPKYDSGVYHKNKSSMIVNKGLGYGTIPFRLFNRPEIVCIELSEKIMSKSR